MATTLPGTMSRSQIMASVKARDTRPEMIVRRQLHSLGYRYRLHRRDLPGRPDLAFPSRRKVIFVHGCFWHGHGCAWGRLPKTNLEYWTPKIAANVARDRESVAKLHDLGWDCHVVWQCQLRDLAAVQRELTTFLGAGRLAR